MRIVIEELSNLTSLSQYADSRYGLRTADTNRFIGFFWETNSLIAWELHQSSVSKTTLYSGKSNILLWEKGSGNLSKYAEIGLASLQGSDAWGKKGIVVSLIGNLPVTIYDGDCFDNNCAALWPFDENNLKAIWTYCSANEFKENVRKLDQKLNVTNATLLKVPFDLEYWQKIAAEKYPNGLPKPYSDDPTQWLFHGHPVKAENALQVAVARLLGYRWPAEVEKVATASSGCQNARNTNSDIIKDDENKSTASSGCQNKSKEDSKSTAGSGCLNKSKEDSKSTAGSGCQNKSIEDSKSTAGSGCHDVYDTLSDEAKQLIQEVKELQLPFDEDGIVCITPVYGEQPAAERLRQLLQKTWGYKWSNSVLADLLKQAGSTKTNLEDWLRDEFFANHCKVFQNRPFVWHIWDGRKDGFSALVNYHKLDKEALKKLIYTYLGDWIRQCEAKRKASESGADGLLSAALNLKEKLELILVGEQPYDIFVRWKKLEDQPIGWEPDLNDGVRLNIRPFVEAGVLRSRFNIKWGIDRGKNPAGSPWGEIRDNDRHLSLEEKSAKNLPGS